MDNMVRVYENILDNEFCQKLIDKFEIVDNKTVWNDYRKFSDILLFDNAEFWKDEIPVCLDAFTKIIEKYKEDLPWPEKYKSIFPSQYSLEGMKLKKYLPNDEDEFPWHIDVSSQDTNARFLAFFIYLDDNEAGETEFIEDNISTLSVKCIAGRALVFPPMFPWLHCGRKPVKKPKYLLQSYLHYVSPEVSTAELEKSKRMNSQEKEI
jgi:hypothetical protein